MINPIEADEITRGILSSPRETRSIEFKPSFPWPSNKTDLINSPKAQEVIAAILAMSNLRDGGKIILGVEKSPSNNSYTCPGISPAHLQTYDQDAIFEAVRNCGDPEPSFQVLNVLWDQKNFIVFAIQSFVLTPVIATNSNYLRQEIRSMPLIRTDKPETKKVTAPAEMREIIDLAVERELDAFSSRMQRVFRAMSHAKVIKSTADDQKKFAAEMGDL